MMVANTRFDPASELREAAAGTQDAKAAVTEPLRTGLPTIDRGLG
jgi:hypothetical protein